MTYDPTLANHQVVIIFPQKAGYEHFSFLISNALFEDLQRPIEDAIKSGRIYRLIHYDADQDETYFVNQYAKKTWAVRFYHRLGSTNYIENLHPHTGLNSIYNKWSEISQPLKDGHYAMISSHGPSGRSNYYYTLDPTTKEVIPHGSLRPKAPSMATMFSPPITTKETSTHRSANVDLPHIDEPEPTTTPMERNFRMRLTKDGTDIAPKPSINAYRFNDLPEGAIFQFRTGPSKDKYLLKKNEGSSAQCTDLVTGAEVTPDAAYDNATVYYYPDAFLELGEPVEDKPVTKRKRVVVDMTKDGEVGSIATEEVEVVDD
jgi:hypothetical protein